MKSFATVLMKLSLLSTMYNLLVDGNPCAIVNSIVGASLGSRKSNLSESNQSSRVDCFGLGKTVATSLEWFFMSKSNRRNALNVQFSLSSRNQPQRVQVTTGEQFGLEWTDFRIERETVVIVHGFLSHGQQSWITDMEESFLQWVRDEKALVLWVSACFLRL